jgi:sugar/nucleoside kinase (ribokinase family)
VEPSVTIVARPIGPGRSDHATGRADAQARIVIGVGGIGWGQFLRLGGARTLGRNESRSAQLVDARDYCKLHIVLHWVAALTRQDDVPPHIVAVGNVGDDEPGRRLLDEMGVAGIDTRGVAVVPDRPTTYSVALQYPDGAGCNVTSSNGASASLTPSRVRQAAASIPSTATEPIAIALPEVPMRTRRAFLAALNGRPAFRVASFTSAEIRGALRDGHLADVDLLALNEDEAASLLGRQLDHAAPREFLGDLASALTALQPEIQIALTAGARGAFGFHRGLWDHCRAPRDLPVVSTAGAGDAFLAGVIAAQLAGLPLANADHSGSSLSDRGVASGLDLGVLVAALKIGAADTIPAEAGRSNVLALADRLGVSERRWPAAPKAMLR